MHSAHPLHGLSEKLSSKRKSTKADKKKEDDEAPEAQEFDALPSEIPVETGGAMIDDIPIPEEFMEEVKPAKRKKNIDISVD